MSGPALIIMAAGIGSRYGGLKQIEPIGPNGEIILDYSVFDAKKAGFQNIVFVINRDIDRVFRERINQTIANSIEIDYVYQELADLPSGFHLPPKRVKPWGTAHAVLSCKHIVDTNFAVINADDFYGRSAYQSMADRLRQDAGQYNEFFMVAYQLKKTLTEHGSVSRGVCEIDPNGRLISVRELTRIQIIDGEVKYSDDGNSWHTIPNDSQVSMNMWGFTVDLFKILDQQFEQFLTENYDNLKSAEFFLPEVVNRLLEQEQISVEVIPTSEKWFGVTYQEDVQSVVNAIRNKIAEGIYPNKLWG
jgi:NDP-sugar pyrophosphorylase family protein